RGSSSAAPAARRTSPCPASGPGRRIYVATAIESTGVPPARRGLLRRPVDLRRDGGAELGQQVGGAVEVVERDHLDGAVHVAVRDADQAGGDAVTAQLHDVGVGAGGAGGAADLHGDLVLAGGLLQPVED